MTDEEMAKDARRAAAEALRWGDGPAWKRYIETGAADGLPLIVPKLATVFLARTKRDLAAGRAEMGERIAALEAEVKVCRETHPKTDTRQDYQHDDCG